MSTTRRRIRFWLVAPVVVLSLLFGLDAAYGQRRPPRNIGGMPPINPGGFQGVPGNIGGNPGGIVGGNPGGGFPPGTTGIPPNPGIADNPMPPGLPNGPPMPPGLPNNPPVTIQRTCTCSKCLFTFVVPDGVTPTSCPQCGAKIDAVIGDTGPGAPRVRPSAPADGVPRDNPTGPGNPASPPAPVQNYTPPPRDATPSNSESAGFNPTFGKPGRELEASVIIWVFIGFAVISAGLLVLGGAMLVVKMVQSSESTRVRPAAPAPKRRRNYDA